MIRKLNLSLLLQLMVIFAAIGWAGVGFGGELPFLTIGTGNTTGVYYSAGHAVAKVYNPSGGRAWLPIGRRSQQRIGRQYQ